MQNTWVNFSPFLRFVQLLAFAQGGNKPLLDAADSSPMHTWTAGAPLQGKALAQRWRAGLEHLCVTEKKMQPHTLWIYSTVIFKVMRLELQCLSMES